MVSTNALNSSIKYSIFPLLLITVIVVIKSFNAILFIQSLIKYLVTGISLKSNIKYESNRSSCATLIVSLIFDSVYL